MKANIIILFLFIPLSVLISQKPSFSVTLDKDTIFMDEVIRIEFLLDNLSGNFVQPDFKQFRVVSGPNTSSSFSMINGAVSQKKSYSFILMPESSGNLEIGPASVKAENTSLISDPIPVYVFDNNNKSGHKQSQKRIFTYGNEMVTDTTGKSAVRKRVLKKF
jgi:hypothetical protein